MLFKIAERTLLCGIVSGYLDELKGDADSKEYS